MRAREFLPLVLAVAVGIALGILLQRQCQWGHLTPPSDPYGKRLVRVDVRWDPLLRMPKDVWEERHWSAAQYDAGDSLCRATGGNSPAAEAWLTAAFGDERAAIDVLTDEECRAVSRYLDTLPADSLQEYPAKGPHPPNLATR